MTVAATITGITFAARDTITLAVATAVVGAHLNAAILSRVASLTVAHRSIVFAVFQGEAC